MYRIFMPTFNADPFVTYDTMEDQRLMFEPQRCLSGTKKAPGWTRGSKLADQTWDHFVGTYLAAT